MAATTKATQRVAGLLLIALGVGTTVWLWGDALEKGSFLVKLALLPPIMVTMGLAMLLFPIDKDRLLAEHGVESVTNLSHYPPAWKVLMVLGVLGGIGDVVALRYL